MADIRGDKSECLHYDNPDFRVYYRYNYIPANTIFPETSMSSHWHDEVELIFVTKGAIDQQVNGRIIELKAGEGVFINSRQMHLIIPSSEDCELHCLIFHPMLISSSKYVADRYVHPIVDNDSIQYVKLSDKELWQKNLLESVSALRKYEGDRGRLAEGNEIRILRTVYDLWNHLYYGISPEVMNTVVRNQGMESVKSMVSYIHEYYSHKVTLEEICVAGNVGKTKANALFAQYLNTTPIEYVKNYRLDMGRTLLVSTDLSITEIVYNIGFGDCSYFTKEFKKHTGCTPKEYRELIQDVEKMRF